jgi:hypothetical protein
MFNILTLLAKSVPVIAVLILALRYFLKKEKAYIAQINNLQKELRSNEKETLQVLTKLTQTLDKVVENNEEDREDILKEIKSLNKTLSLKIDALKK